MTENEATEHACAEPVDPTDPAVPDGDSETGGVAEAIVDAHDTVESPQGPAREITTESVVEAVLFASDTPLPAAKLAQIVGVGDAREMKKHIAALNQKYEAASLTFRIEEIAGGFRMLTLPDYNTWLTKLSKARSESKLSQAALETLAVVAYKQPVLRADVEAIRGVSVGDMLNRLREFGLVKIVGRAEEVGRPMLYGTTKRFLEVFGLADLDELPQVEELRQPDA